jgi:outer membrane protein assembly factor BamD (BamD/ComL family)
VITLPRLVRRLSLVVLPLAMTLSGACAPTTRALVPPGTTEPDKFLFDRGMTLLGEKKWLTAREFLKQVVETYTQSPYRPDAKLGVGDTYLGEGSSEAIVLAINEYSEFLSFYPTNPRADYAQRSRSSRRFSIDIRTAASSPRSAPSSARRATI